MFQKLVLLVALVISTIAALPVQQPQDATALQAESQPLTTSYRFGYNDGQSIRSETRDLTGNVAGSFSYIGPDGVVRTTHYTAGAEGYNVVPGPEVPQAIGETAPVISYTVGTSQPTAASTTTAQAQNLYPYPAVSPGAYGTAVPSPVYGYLPNQQVGYQSPVAPPTVYQAQTGQSATTYNVVPTSQYTTGSQTQTTAVNVVPATRTAAYQPVPASSYYRVVPSTQTTGSQPVAAYQVAPATPTYTGYQVYPSTQHAAYQYPVVRYT